LETDADVFGITASRHPLELFTDLAWDTYCPVNRLGEFVGQTVTTCGLVVEQRTHHQITGEPMKFLTVADWTGMVETELFAPTYKSYGLATVRYPVLEIEARVEPFDNRRGFSLRVLRRPNHAPRRNKANPALHLLCDENRLELYGGGEKFKDATVRGFRSSLSFSPPPRRFASRFSSCRICRRRDGFHIRSRTRLCSCLGVRCETPCFGVSTPLSARWWA